MSNETCIQASYKIHIHVPQTRPQDHKDVDLSLRFNDL